jgi:hypothetical protein
MENEAPKKEEGASVAAGVKDTGVVQAVVVAETVIVTESVVPVEDSVAEPIKKKLSLKEVANKVGSYISKVDRTTKTFVVIFGVFALLFVGYVYFKGYFVAATVNGVDMSRWSVVWELEKQAGKSVLDTMITKRLIESEIKKQKIVVTVTDIDAEIKKVEEQIAAQGGTLEQALASQGMTMDDLRDQIMINQSLERILADKIVVSDEEIDQYLSTSQMPPSGGASSSDLRDQAREQLKARKFSTEASQWVADMRAQAAIEYYGEYGEL